MEIAVLALDLEATLISDAYSMIPRPGLASFLDFCNETFKRVTIFTTVDDETARDLLNELCTRRLLPDELYRRLELVDWHGEHKDLRFVPEVSPAEVVLVDDDEHWIRPEQQAQWISIMPWRGSEVEELDTELSRVQLLLERRLST